MEDLNRLQRYKGTGTSIVTLIIPVKCQISHINTHLIKELATAKNIKDKNNRKSVIDALKSSLEFFRGLKSIPSNGLATFTGWYV
jgi:peptide chain release factor subunit 1